jgi:hypothetical protein
MAVKVRQHKGAWWIFIDYHGKRKAKRVGSSKRAAEIAAEKIQAKIALGQFAILEEKEHPISFATYAKEWLTTYAAVRCKPSSVREYEVVLSRYLNPIFGDKPLPTIVPGGNRQAVDRLDDPPETQQAATIRNPAATTLKNTVFPLRYLPDTTSKMLLVSLPIRQRL